MKLYKPRNIQYIHYTKNESFTLKNYILLNNTYIPNNHPIGYVQNRIMNYTGIWCTWKILEKILNKIYY